ncbi:Cytochrome p450 [Mycena sanguinolenta]|uniref:Cytochrome p450 n=1 Tax=Mycena sanguinolenta TaxID=230812 RepID=A0A8H6ZL40_9AGAR|nr:Cytochrome p450 [Mycena sanguinolenta]
MAFSPMQNAILTLVSALLYVVYRTYIRTIRNSLELPPGPPGLPFIGNIYDVPASKEWLAYMEMSRKYDSDVISLNFVGDTVIVLNSVTAIDDLLEDRSAIYSSRPTLPMLNDLIGYDWHFGFMPYGPAWKERRKMFAQQFQPSQVHLHRPAELNAARVLLQHLLETPRKYERHLRHMAGMVILSTSYGIDIKPENDPHIEISEKALEAMARAALRGNFMVDALPILRYVPEWFPGAGFKKLAREWRVAVTAMPKVPFEFVKRSRAAGTAKSSIASRMLDEIAETPGQNQEESEATLRDMLGAAYAGGWSRHGTRSLRFCPKPSSQKNLSQTKKGQAAVDAAVGTHRLPDFGDNIPYVDAIVREVLRWRPVLPLGGPHALTQDDKYKGYHIPAGAVVLGNSWAVLHDEKLYGADTDRFIPERWLTADGQINTAMREPNVAFGYGRRVCPGKDMAQWSVWICIASILSALNVTKSLDKDGVPIEPSGEYTSAMLCYPVPHECDIRPRSEAARAMVQSAVQS